VHFLGAEEDGSCYSRTVPHFAQFYAPSSNSRTLQMAYLFGILVLNWLE